MSSFGNVNVNVTHNIGIISLGDGNTIDLRSLPAEQAQRVGAAVGALLVGGAPNTDAAELKAVVAAATNEKTRTERVGQWLLKLAPAAAGVAGSLLNPALGKVAEQLAGWVAKRFEA